MSKPLDKGKMIQALKIFYENNGRTPLYIDFSKGTPNAATYSKYFGSWDNALKEAGLLEIKSPKRQPKVYSDEELLDKLKDYCIKYGKTKPRLDTNNDECHSNATYISRFGSMENALKLIGMEHLWGDKNKFIKQWTREEIINELIKFCKENNRFPKTDDFENTSPSTNAIRRQFNSNWSNILEELKEYVPELENEINDYLYKYTKEEMINRLKLLYKENNQIPTYEIITNTDYMPSYKSYHIKFGSLKLALIEAELYDLIENKDKKKYNKYHTEDELLKLLKDYIIKHNKIPNYNDLNESIDMPSINTYENRFGSYLIALELIGYKDQHISNNQTLKRYTDEEMINNMKILYNELGRIPNFEDIDLCEYSANSSTYYNRYGNLTNVFDLCGIPYNKSDKRRYNNFGKYIKKYITDKGAICLSKSEYIITCWLELHNIIFDKEVYYKKVLNNDNSRRKFDWIIYHNNKIYYVEFFGLIRNKLYKQGALQKIEDCKKNNIDLIAIYPKDLKNKSLEEIFSFLN